MQFIKNLFKDESVIGLSSLRKKNEFLQITVPDFYKRTHISDTGKNYFLL